MAKLRANERMKASSATEILHFCFKLREKLSSLWKSLSYLVSPSEGLETGGITDLKRCPLTFASATCMYLHPNPVSLMVFRWLR